MKTIYRLLLILSICMTHSSFAETLKNEFSKNCSDLQKNYKFSRLQLGHARSDIKNYEELYNDLSFNNDISKAIVVASLAALSGGATYGMAGIYTGVVAGLDGALVIFAAFQTYMVSGYAITNLLENVLEESGDETSQELLVEAYSKLKGALKIFDNQLKILEKERQNVDLDWDRNWDSITLGYTSRKRAQKLYEIAKYKHAVAKAKVVFLEKSMAKGACPLK